ncbi:MAG: methyltransferase domain-containing protein [Allosphingosinicella sp.]
MSSAAFERSFVRPRAGRTLIVGSRLYEGREDRRGRYPPFPVCVGLDMQPGPGVDLVHDLEERLVGSFDHVECLSVLEHARRPWLVAANIERLLVPGGTLFVSAPFVHRVHAYPNDYFRFTPAGVESLFPGIVWEASRLVGPGIYDALRVAVIKVDDHPYLARSASMCFGRRR